MQRGWLLLIPKSFSIPITGEDIQNKYLRKEESLFVREENPISVDYTYGDYVYRGVPIKLIDKIVVSYQTSKPTEIFIAHRVGEDGELKKSTQTIHFESAKDLSAIQFGGIDPNPTPIPTP